MMYYTKNTKLGFITITEEDGFITSLAFNKNSFSNTENESVSNYLSETINNAFMQLEEYFAGERKIFDLPLNPRGTEFQRKVWDALLTIPYGETRCYKDIAFQIGNPNAQRAVGMANHKNNIPIFIPCHRVIASDGTIGGYSDGLAVKRKLLMVENVAI